jgi:FtsP/CotA-like multicopper oxidase with cupredoxin domain
MAMDRRGLLRTAGAACITAAAPRTLWPAEAQTPVDYTLRIATGLVELAPQHVVSTTLYNGQFPGPLLRLKKGKRAMSTTTPTPPR